MYIKRITYSYTCIAPQTVPKASFFMVYRPFTRLLDELQGHTCKCGLHRGLCPKSNHIFVFIYSYT